MAIRQGLIGNPVIQGLLGGGGPAAIKAAKNKALFESMPRGQAVRMSAPGAIVRPPDNSLGQGLSALGKALGDIGDMRAESAAQKDLAALFNPAPSEEDLLEGVEPSAPKVNSQQLATFLAKHSKAPNASKQAGMLYENARREEAEQRGFDFQDQQRLARQEYTSKEAKELRAYQSGEKQKDRTFRLTENSLNRLNDRLISSNNNDVKKQLAKIRASASQKTVMTLRGSDAFPLVGGGILKDDAGFNSNDLVEITFTGGVPSGVNIISRDIRTTEGGGSTSATQEYSRLNTKGAGNGPDVIGPGASSMPKGDFKGAAGVGIGKLMQGVDWLKEATGMNDPNSKSATAAVRALTALNNNVVNTAATTNAILKRAGRTTNLMRETTLETLPKLGVFDSEAGFGNMVNLTIDNLKGNKALMDDLAKNSNSPKIRRESAEESKGYEALIKQYEAISKDLEPEKTPVDIRQLIRDADSVVNRKG